MISVKGFKKSLWRIRCFKRDNLDIKPQEVVVIIGPSGSGKTTLLRCLNLLESITDGHVYIDGVDLADKD